jgi:hypothetical protein
MQLDQVGMQTDQISLQIDQIRMQTDQVSVQINKVSIQTDQVNLKAGGIMPSDVSYVGQNAAVIKHQ